MNSEEAPNQQNPDREETNEDLDEPSTEEHGRKKELRQLDE